MAFFCDSALHQRRQQVEQQHRGVAAMQRQAAHKRVDMTINSGDTRIKGHGKAGTWHLVDDVSVAPVHLAAVETP